MAGRRTVMAVMNRLGRLLPVAAAQLLAIALSSPAQGFLDTGGYFSRATVGDDGAVYVSTKGFGLNSGKGAVWAFNECDEGTCSGTNAPLRWVFRPGDYGHTPEIEIFSIPTTYTKDCPSGPDRRVTWVGTQKDKVYALVEDSVSCVATAPAPGVPPIASGDCPGCPRLPADCVWFWEVSGSVMAGAAIDSAGNAYVGTMASRDMYRFDLPDVCAALDGSNTPQEETVAWTGDPKPNRAYLRFTPVVDEANGQVFVGAKGGGIYSFDLETGEMLWSYDLGPEPSPSPGSSVAESYHVGGALSLVGDYLYAAGADQVVKFDTNDLPAPNQAPISRYRLGNQMLTRTAPVVFDEGGCESVYITRRDPGTIFKLPAFTCGSSAPGPTPGANQSCQQEARFRVDGTISWVTPAVGAVPWTWPNPLPEGWEEEDPEVGPAFAEDHIVFSGAHKDDCFYAVTPVRMTDGSWRLKKVWDFQSPEGEGEFFASPAVSEGTDSVYIGDLAARFWSLRTSLSGNPLCSGGGGTTCTDQQNRDRIEWGYDTETFTRYVPGTGSSILNTCCPEAGNSCEDPGPGACLFPTPTQTP
jgi:outer membrane protein assembly factor BamB